tara:strand:+ start:251 stop:2146 length:1896 start_codon:yes stop_codon:yes gene_type:complete
MRKILLLLCIPFIGLAQADYELDFNSATQDYVQMSNASSVITNKIAFSMSAWVYPQANPSAHSGIMGFRNNTDTDFYLLQLQNSNNVEARFRNSSGVNYDIVSSNLLDFNQWQHIAFTYDGSYIRLYKDGALVDSSAANGIIIQNTLPLQLGKLDWGNTGFYMTGRLDEIRLWDVALSQTEINNWMCIPIDLTHPNYNNLMGYWRMNDGLGTTATDLSVNANNGILNNNPTWQVTTTCFGSTTQPLTYVPDDNFENYLEANGIGDGITLNDNVFTSAIDTVAFLDVSNQNISDLTGIEAFTVLTYLNCEGNQLSILDVSQNTSLTYLECQVNQLSSLDISQNTGLLYLYTRDNQLTNLDISNNISLIDLECHYNQITSLNVGNNTSLTDLDCSYNQLTSLDISDNTALNALWCQENQLTTLDLRNGNNTNFTYFNLQTNPNLFCINVDNVIWSTANWTFANGNIDTQHYFSTNCSTVAFNCTDSLEVTDVIIDNANLTMNIAIYNGYNYFINYPYVTFTIDANGDTIQSGNMNLFGAINLDTTWYNYSLSNAIFPTYPLTMYFVYSDGYLVADTCILTYNSTPTAIIDINVSSRKLISIVNVLGTESKGTRNELLLYIYDDGAVEKQIIVE